MTYNENLLSKWAVSTRQLDEKFLQTVLGFQK